MDGIGCDFYFFKGLLPIRKGRTTAGVNHVSFMPCRLSLPQAFVAYLARLVAPAKLMLLAVIAGHLIVYYLESLNQP